MPVRRLARAFSSRAGSAPATPDESFDPEFYRLSNPDLRDMNDAALSRHYHAHGKLEGRAGNREQAMAALEADGKPLPRDFFWRDYLACNPDLQATLTTEWAATTHYLRYGRAENRQHYAFDAALYGDLYHPDGSLSPNQLRDEYESVGRVEGRIRSVAALAASRDLPGLGGWIRAIRTREFRLLNWSWASHVRTVADVVDAMLESGLRRLAPVAFDQTFDPDYYREVHPKSAKLSDETLYRDWLFRGHDLGYSGSGRQQLARLGLPLTEFPAAFSWKTYLVDHRLRNQSRWEIIEDAVRTGGRKQPIPVHGEGAAAFLATFGQAVAFKHDEAAIDSLERARASAPLETGALQSLADSYTRRGKWRSALAAYGQVAETGEANLWTFVNGARAALACEQPAAAMALLAGGSGRVAGHPLFRTVVREAVEATFAAESDDVRPLYAAGRREEADAATVAAAERAGASWATLDPLGAQVAPTGAGRVVVLANTDLRQCTHYRVEQKVQYLRLTGRSFDVFSAGDVDAFMGALAGASAAIFYRLAATPANLRAIDYARALGIPTYYEIDDLIFDPSYPDPFETYGGAISREVYDGLLAGVPLFRLAMSRCDYGIASTTALARSMEPLVRTGEVFVLPNGLDSRNPEPPVGLPVRVRRDNDVVLFYGSGTKAHNSDFLELAGPALAEIMASRPDVRLMIVGYLTLDERLGAFRDRITTVPFVPDARGFWSLLAEADINLAVLAPSLAADAKSEIKWLEAAVLGIPSVVSDTDRYREVLDDGVDALIARDAASWRTALNGLIGDADLRREMGARAQAKALEVYAPEANAARLGALLRPADERGAETRRALTVPGRRPRVLLVNAFFPPQTIGGATRVVRDNLDAFLAAPERAPFDFAVVCTDHDAEAPYRTRVEGYNGCSVFRISTPQAVNMDWNPLDPIAGDLFAEVLDSWKPDLVHFHAVQRLTGAAVQACADAGVPYLVTVHDAWWVSDHQFLIDEHDRLREPCEPIPYGPPAPASVGDAMARRRYLTTLLHGAEAVLGVSRTFTDLYRGCGFERAVAVPNGVSPMALEPRCPSPSGRVRLIHLGGRSAHKGHDLLQAALRQSAFANLELTVVDHGRVGGVEVAEVWGATPVRIVGKTPQERVASLYAEQDVLLAPSIWPESFGLVTREALTAGLWVVASNLGAMGEDVTPGVNGWVIDVSEPAELLAALAEMNRDPTRFLVPPPPVTLRTADEQARDLLGIYADLLARAPTPPALQLARWAGQPTGDRAAPTGLDAYRRKQQEARWGPTSAEAS